MTPEWAAVIAAIAVPVVTLLGLACTGLLVIYAPGTSLEVLSSMAATSVIYASGN